MILAENIKFFLQKLNLLQKDLAKLAIVDEGTISNMIKGKSVAKLNLKRVAYALSQKTNIPYELFEDGQALLKKDFSKYLRNRNNFCILMIIILHLSTPKK